MLMQRLLPVISVDPRLETKYSFGWVDKYQADGRVLVVTFALPLLNKGERCVTGLPEIIRPGFNPFLDREHSLRIKHRRSHISHPY